jgi:hypothetical protein
MWVLVFFPFNSLWFTVAGYLRELGFGCPHLSMYSYCSVCEDVGVSVFSFQFLIINCRRVLTAMFSLSSSVRVFFFCLMDNKRSCLLAALVNKDNNTFLSYHYQGSVVTRCTSFNNSLLSFLERPVLCGSDVCCCCLCYSCHGCICVCFLWTRYGIIFRMCAKILHV